MLALASEWAQRRLCSAKTAAATSDEAATKHSQQHQRWSSLGGGSALYRLLLGALAAYYVGRTVTRNAEWANEEVLMASNLALYPDNNTMTVYGLGCVREAAIPRTPPALLPARCHASPAMYARQHRACSLTSCCRAVALYKGQLEDAERYLKQAITESSMVEPRILLSQLYWKHKPYDIVEGAWGGCTLALP